MDIDVEKKLLEIGSAANELSPNPPHYFRGEPKIYETISASLRRERRIILPIYSGENNGMKFNASMDDARGIKFDKPQRVGIKVEKNSFIYHSVTNMVFEVDIQNPDMLFQMAVVASEIVGQQDELSSDTETHLGILQHLGYPTPYIDFTKDCLVSLYFACRESFSQDGRIIILGCNSNHEIKDMTNAGFSVAKERAIAQKSVMLKRLELNKAEDNYQEIYIPAHLKTKILQYLEDCGINSETLFPDTLESESRYEPYKKFYQGVKVEIDGDHIAAIESYTQAINLDPDLVDAYKRRARILYYKVDLRKAHSDIEKVFSLERSRGLYEIGREDELIGFHPICYESNAGCMHALMSGIYRHFGNKVESDDYLRKSRFIRHCYQIREKNIKG